MSPTDGIKESDMKYKKRKFTPRECMHIYQRTINGFNIFYDREDALVFYTIFSVLAKFYNVRVLALCLMVDHVHSLLSSDVLSNISAFVRHYTSLFVSEYNQSIGRHGPLFHKSFGSAPKVGGKKVRSTVVYIGNSPVEKALCSKAEEYRWNFLAYLENENPFSTYKPTSLFSMKLRRAFAEAKGAHGRNRYLTYGQVIRMFDGLAEDESELLTHYIIRLYLPVDKDMLMSYYASYSDMLNAMCSTAGGEYDIREVFNPGPDVIYEKMESYVHGELHVSPTRRVIAMPMEAKLEIAGLLSGKFAASGYELSKFLHLKSCGR
jgi:REP element-mobilizing transposase RayT